MYYWLISILGLALVVAPFVLGYTDEATPLWTSLILGAVVTLSAGYKAWVKDRARWEEWLAGLAGLLAVIAPFVLDFTDQDGALWANVILGAAVAILAGYIVFLRRPELA